MGVVDVAAKIKRIHPEDMALISIGTFYYTFGRDAYILSYMFDYKLMRTKENNVYSCAFPKKSFPKIISTLENNKINYIILDRRNNYDVEDKCDNKNLNTYDKWYQKAKKYINIKLRMDNIYMYILQNAEDEGIREKVRKMENILNETGEI